MATDKNINDSSLIKLVNADFANVSNRIYASRVSGTEDGYALITELISYIQDNVDLSGREEVIERPTTQPAIDTGVLTIDLNNRKQGLFEPRLSVGILAINEDFNLVIDNKTNGDLVSIVLTLTDTRVITFESDVVCSPTPSTISTWVTGAKTLTITTGTNNIVELQLERYKTGAKWLLKVAEVVE